MLFRQLEYFVALARERHFARAAAACHVSQPALSEAIRKLERELKVSLVRRGRSFEGLTPEGDRVVLWARRILADHNELRQELDALRAGVSGELRLGVIPSASSTAALLIDPFCADHPLVRVRVETSLRSAAIVERVRRFELEAGVIYPDGLDIDGLQVTPLYQDHHVLLADSALLPDRFGAVTWSDALRLPLCLLHQGMRGRQLIDEALAGHGLRVEPRLETDSVVVLLTHVARGRWATIVPQTWIDALGVPGGARAVRLVNPSIDAGVALVTRAGRPSSLMTSALIATARTAGMAAVLSTPMVLPEG